MKIKDMFRVLVSKFNIGDLVDTIRNLRKTLKEVDIPLWATAAKEFKTLKHPKAKQLETIINRGCKDIYRGAMAAGIYDAMKNAQLILDYLEELVSTEFDHVTQVALKDGLSFKKANILQYVDAMDFFVSYGRKINELLCVLEAAEKSPTAQRIEDAFTPADLKYIDDNVGAFIHSIALASLSVKDLAKSFEEIPDAVANADSEEVMGRTVGFNKIDPFQMRGFVTTRSPVYHLQMWLAERQVRKLQQAIETKKLIELRLLKLRELQKGGEAPANIEQQIAYQEARLDRLTREINAKEEEYAGR